MDFTVRGGSSQLGRISSDLSLCRAETETFDHVIEPVAGGTRLTERARITGPLGHALGPFMCRKLEALFATSVASVARQAEAAEVRAEPTS